LGLLSLAIGAWFSWASGPNPPWWPIWLTLAGMIFLFPSCLVIFLSGFEKFNPAFLWVLVVAQVIIVGYCDALLWRRALAKIKGMRSQNIEGSNRG
jgi:O-antigen/teichoic acid export membrane protein